jgi:hypothetical protein
LITVAATLILGIVPGKILGVAKAGAATYPSVNASAPETTAAGR